jgi:hypothetical protein
MDSVGTRQYAIELFVQERWQELYRTSDQAEAEQVWQRTLETQPRSQARLIELEVLRSSPGS